MPEAPPAGPLAMRAAVASYVEAVHGSYLAQAEAQLPAVRGRMPLLAAGAFTVAAVAARKLHILATTESLGPLQGPEVAVDGTTGALAWSLRFFDPVVVPALGLIDESEGPAFDAVRAALGIGTVLYHLVAGDGSQLSGHHAGHVGTGLANGHAQEARDFETIRRRARGREALVDEMAGAALAGLPRAHALLAAAIAPQDEGLAGLARQSRPDPDAVRQALLARLDAPPRDAPPAADR